MIKKKNITTVVFDLDGTLLNTLQDLTNATNFALEENNMKKRTMEEVRQFVGNGIVKLMERAVPEGTSENEFAKVMTDFKAYYDVHCLDVTKPYDGVIELIEALAKDGYQLAIVSNKIDNAVKELNKRFFSKYINVAIGEKEGIRKKPAPDTVYQALKELGVSKEEAVYVGDSDVDLATAKNSGLPCISVLWGFRDKDFLIDKGALTFADSADKVKSIVDNMN